MERALPAEQVTPGKTVYLQVLPFASAPHALTYTAAVPLSVGCLVRIRVKGRCTIGLVAAVSTDPGSDVYPLSPIEGCVYPSPMVYPQHIRLIDFLVRYYGCTLSVALETVLPACIRNGRPFRPCVWLQLTSKTPCFSARAFKMRAVYEWLQAHSPVSEKAFSETFPKCTAILKRLITQGYVQQCATDSLEPADVASVVTFDKKLVAEVVVPMHFTEEQTNALRSLTAALRKRTYATHVLWGVTGSGKTEVYHALFLHAKVFGMQTLYLVPEVMLSEQALAKLKARLEGHSMRVCVWHYRLPQREKRQVWQQVLNGTCDVVLGTRSAVFLPFKRLGLVVVDEEHEPSYKQSDNPRYHGRDLAVMRAQWSAALCVLGSATPSVETWAHVQDGGFQLQTLTQRPMGGATPTFHVVDMRYEKPNFEGARVLSALLREKISVCLDRKEQTLLFLNRRGYAPYLYCVDCGKRLMCAHCNNGLVLHRSDAILRCHVCDGRVQIPNRCPSCRGVLRVSVGFGTQRVEACLQRFYKRARILRLDSDSIRQQSDWYEAILERRYDIIIGTQMVAKGLDFPQITLIGVLQAEGQATPEDFRSTERLFQLLVQVSGRAGRSQLPSEVVIQTFSPQSVAIHDGQMQDIRRFLDKELALRRQYAYPPFRHLIRHLFRSVSEEKLASVVHQWRLFLQQQALLDLEILGPAAPYLNRAHRYYRQHMLYVVKDVMRLLPQLQSLWAQFKKPACVMSLWDVDPVDFR